MMPLKALLNRISSLWGAHWGTFLFILCKFLIKPWKNLQSKLPLDVAAHKVENNVCDHFFLNANLEEHFLVILNTFQVSRMPIEEPLLGLLSFSNVFPLRPQITRFSSDILHSSEKPRINTEPRTIQPTPVLYFVDANQGAVKKVHIC